MSKKFLYKIVYQQLEKEINAHGKIGDFLPPMPLLCKKFNASAITITRALNELAAAGIVKRIKHCGTKIVKTSSAEPLAELHKKHCIRVLSVHPKRWLLMQIIEQKLVEFCRYNPQYELQCEYAVREEQIERIQLKDYDFIIADSGQVKLMMHREKIRRQLSALDKLPGFYFNENDFAPSTVRMGSAPGGRLYGMGLVTGPNLQLVNISENVPQKLDSLSSYWSAWLSQLHNFQQKCQPLLEMALDWRYMEPVFRMHNIDIFDPAMQCCLLDNPAAADLLEELAYYLYSEKMWISPGNKPEQLEKVQNSIITCSQVPVKIASLIFLRPGVNCTRFKIRPLPQARKKAAWLFWEGILVGKNCDSHLAAELLNFLQSASVQSSLQGCSGLPARLDMQKILLASYEPEFPGITEAFTQSMEFADNPYVVSYPVLQMINFCFRRVLRNGEPVKKTLNSTVQQINNLLRKK